jgi:hypothetical protein
MTGRWSLTKPVGLSLLPVRCPRCGWNTLGLSDSDAVLLCPNCHELWEEAHGTFVEREYHFVKTDIAGPRYLPFWTYRLTVKTSRGDITDFHTYARHIAFTRSLEKVKNRPLTLFVAAFKLRAETQRLNISRRYTYRQPMLSPGEVRGGLAWGPVLPDKTARNYGRTIFISTLAENNKNSVEFVSGLAISLSSPVLSFIPYLEDGRYLKDPVGGFTIQRELLTDEPARIGPI